MPDAAKYPVYDADHTNLLGMFSKPDPSSLREGEFALLKNVRWCDQRCIRARGEIPAALTASAALAASDYRGCFVGNFNGSQIILAAYRASSKTRIYSYSAGAWTQLTYSGAANLSYPFGDTTFGTDAAVDFCVVTDPFDGQDCLIISNGVDNPLVYSYVSAFGGYVLAKHQTVTPPSKSAAGRIVAYWENYLNVGGNHAYPAYTNSTGARFAFSTTGAGASQRVRVTFNAAQTNDNIIADFTATAIPFMDLSSVRELAIMCDTQYDQWWLNVKIEIKKNAGSYVTVWDPTSVSYTEPQVATVDESGRRYVLAFNLDHLKGNAQLPQAAFVKLTWVATANSPAATTMDFYVLAGTGNAPGGANHAITYLCSYARAESYTQVYADAQPAALGDIGGLPVDDNGTLLKIPLDTGLHYSYRVYAQNVSSTMLDAGVDTIRVYRRDFGTSDFLLAKTLTVALWASPSVTPAWQMVSGLSYGIVLAGSDDIATSDLSAQLAPKDYHQCLQPGKALRFANNRVFYAPKGTSGSGASIYNQIRVSQKDYPFRFSDITDLNDPDSPCMSRLTGETIQRITALSASSLGSSTVFIRTDTALWFMDGGDSFGFARPRRIGPHGTLSPGSVAEYKTTEIWVDHELQLRELQSDIMPLSRGVFDDQFSSVPTTRRDKIVAVCFGDRYYCALTPAAGSTNTRVLVYNLMRGTLESLDYLPTGVTAEGLAVGQESSTRYIYLFGSDAKLYKYDVGTAGAQDLGTTDITVEIDTGWIHVPLSSRTPDWGEVVLGRFYAWADDVTSGTMNLSATYYPSGTVATASLSLDGSTTQIKRISDDPTNNTGDYAVQMRYSAAVKAGWALRMLGQEITTADGTFDAA